MGNTYTDFVAEQVRQYEPGEPILSARLAKAAARHFNCDEKQAAAAVSNALKRLIDRGCLTDLRRYRRGIYYRAIETPFGESSIKKERLTYLRYIEGGNGYETGHMVLHRMGLMSLMPSAEAIATNRAIHGTRYDEELNVRLIAPKTEISERNWEFLQVLDVVSMIDEGLMDAEDPLGIIAEHIADRKLDYAKLLALANQHYGTRTVLALADVALRAAA